LPRQAAKPSPGQAFQIESKAAVQLDRILRVSSEASRIALHRLDDQGIDRDTLGEAEITITKAQKKS
jgi:hypothetical protein